MPGDEPTAPAAMPSEEEIARVIATALRQAPIPDHIWDQMVASFRELEGKFPDYATGYSVSTDAFRQARSIQALFAPILEEKEREIEQRGKVFCAMLSTGSCDLPARAEAAEARALAAEAALKLVAEQDVTEIALDPDWPRRICAAAIRAQGE